jgi:hypothetical protein
MNGNKWIKNVYFKAEIVIQRKYTMVSQEFKYGTAGYIVLHRVIHEPPVRYVAFRSAS